MRAIIMAAGIGSRISRNVDKPKCLLEIEEKSILRRTVEMLKKNDIEPVIVAGYQHEQIEREVQPLGVPVIVNPFYRVTNSLGSLWFARDYIVDGEDLFLMNADVFWEQDILDILLNEEREALLLADSSIMRLEEGDYFFGCEQGRIVRYGKDLAREIRTHEYVGVGRVRPSFLRVFKEKMNELIEAEQYNYWWEDILYSCSAEQEVFIRDVAGHFWAEVDYIEDYERIMNYIYERNQKGRKKTV
ncbi:NTP transferase domain-containing protein [Selenomonas sp. TAMA-11512]|uniref:phosphocholine cytidylyltransferase family protein n=1 Tax=Selenomonas sp. TAMA-11512 TaxID=3095337 RepID=UPI003089C621|nr:NTP transferase domain-containing protein [Selenomonas sp. TAMA-11512]